MKKIITITAGLCLCLFFAGAFSQNNLQPVIHTTNNDGQLLIRRFDSMIVLENKSETSANISFADLDGDKDLDIVLTKVRHWPLFNKLFFNKGKGEFSVPADLGKKPNKIYSTVVADLDKDGDMDIVVSNDYPDDKLVYFNNGKGVFSLSQTWGDPKWNTRNASVADLNNDGKPDIIAANRQGPSYYCLNDGYGKFPVQDYRVIAAESATTIVPADLNNDRFIDLVVGDQQSGTFIYINDKKGGLNDPISFGEKLVPYSIVIGDLNNDKKPDIVVGYVDSKTTAFFNDRNGVKFTAIKFGDGKGNVYGMALGDINNDGFLDIGVACTDASNVLYISQKQK